MTYGHNQFCTAIGCCNRTVQLDIFANFDVAMIQFSACHTFKGLMIVYIGMHGHVDLIGKEIGGYLMSLLACRNLYRVSAWSVRSDKCLELGISWKVITGL